MSGKHGGKRPGSGPKPGPNGTMEHIGFRADRVARDQMEALAAARGITVSEWLRLAADDFAMRQLAGVR